MRGNSTFDASRRNSHYCVYAITYITTMPPELLELSTTTVLHRFHSNDWWQYLSSKIPLPSDGFSRVRSLNPGQALVFAQGANLDLATMSFAIPENWEQEIKYDHDGDFFECQIRQRITRDRGRSRNNKIKSRSKMF